MTNEGAIDATQSPSALNLKDAYKNGKLTPIQEDIFRSSRPGEEFFDVRRDLIQ